MWLVAAAVALTVGGLERSYEIHLPNGQRPAQAVPLVLVLHGGGSNATQAARMSGMNAKADKEGFIVVYPNGTGARPKAKMLTWNAWRCCGAAMDNKVDDVAFVRAVVDDVFVKYPVDRKRIYATGMSNGAMMTYRLGCEAGEMFAAIAPVAGALNSYDCTSGPRLSVIVFHGTADKHVLFQGGHPEKSFDTHHRADNAVPYAIDVWKQRNKCETPAKRDRLGRAEHAAYTCADGTGVELYAIEGGGHSWPSGATDLMWDFFAKHPRQ